MTADRPSPHELWHQAGGDEERYRRLLEEHGHVVPVEPCPVCGASFRHRHDPRWPSIVIAVDIFGHDILDHDQ